MRVAPTYSSMEKRVSKKQASSMLAEDLFQNCQLNLFQQFLCNTEDEKQKLSNTIELWDNIPRYSISQQAMNKMRAASGGHLALLQLEFEYRKIKYNIQIQPALVNERIKNKESGKIDLVENAYYPSANEELVEEALRKLAVDQKHGFYEKVGAKSGVVFSMHQLRGELRRCGHARSFYEIKQSLDIMSGSSIQIIAETSESHVAYAKSTYLPLVASVTRKRIDIDPHAKWMVQFHPLVTESIDKISYRQFNYQQLMRHKTQLARWLHKLVVNKYTFASKMQPFVMRYSTIKRDSAMLNNYSLERKAIAACNLSMNELVEQKIAHQVAQKDITGKHGKILDVVYTITPTIEFIREVKASSASVSIKKGLISK